MSYRYTYQSSSRSVARRSDISSSNHVRRYQPGAGVSPQKTALSRRMRHARMVGLCVVVLAVATMFHGVVSADGNTPHPDTKVTNEARPAFPTLATQKFTANQKRLLKIAQQEYAHGAISYDSTVLKYSEGFKESWCADFISWMMNQAGMPYKNEEYGYWRIPGVGSLQSYYEDQHAYYDVDEYTPEFGDVAFYFGETPDGGSSEHVAMVLGVEGDRLVTLGGNEGKDGVMRIRRDKLAVDEKGLVGFGSLKALSR